jgi:hypothetical protein
MKTFIFILLTFLFILKIQAQTKEEIQDLITAQAEYFEEQEGSFYYEHNIRFYKDHIIFGVNITNDFLELVSQVYYRQTKKIPIKRIKEVSFKADEDNRSSLYISVYPGEKDQLIMFQDADNSIHHVDEIFIWVDEDKLNEESKNMIIELIEKLIDCYTSGE